MLSINAAGAADELGIHLGIAAVPLGVGRIGSPQPRTNLSACPHRSAGDDGPKSDPQHDGHHAPTREGLDGSKPGAGDHRRPRRSRWRPNHLGTSRHFHLYGKSASSPVAWAEMVWEFAYKATCRMEVRHERAPTRASLVSSLLEGWRDSTTRRAFRPTRRPLRTLLGPHAGRAKLTSRSDGWGSGSAVQRPASADTQTESVPRGREP